MNQDITLLLHSLEQIQKNFSQKFIILLISIIIFAVLLILFFTYLIGKKIGQLNAHKNLSELLKDERLDAVKRSRSVIGGQVFEQIAPLLPDFPSDYADARFLGKPVDFIAFCGLEENAGEYNNSDHEKKCKVNEILFIEVKTEKSQLSDREKAIKEAVEARRVRWVEYRI